MNSVETSRLKKEIQDVLRSPDDDTTKASVIMTLIQGHDNRLLKYIGAQISVVLDLAKNEL